MRLPAASRAVRGIRHAITLQSKLFPQSGMIDG
jgi:hypothetical protein